MTSFRRSPPMTWPECRLCASGHGLMLNSPARRSGSSHFCGSASLRCAGWPEGLLHTPPDGKGGSAPPPAVFNPPSRVEDTVAPRAEPQQTRRHLWTTRRLTSPRSPSRTPRGCRI